MDRAESVSQETLELAILVGHLPGLFQLWSFHHVRFEHRLSSEKRLGCNSLLLGLACLEIGWFSSSLFRRHQTELAARRKEEPKSVQQSRHGDEVHLVHLSC